MDVKLLLMVSCALAATPVFADEPQPFAPKPLSLELPRPCGFSTSLGLNLCSTVVGTPSRADVVFPVGPVRIEYEPSLKGRLFPGRARGAPHLDAPVAGYRESARPELGRTPRTLTSRMELSGEIDSAVK